mmetsp:Transcript_36482/g.74888  ORF Transcript_36482/g.74888 Transcript_36482/m.74888 type:complete len:148 (+) Transcript_36482:91-534(+)
MSDATASQSERPKRDAAKKFLNGNDSKASDKKTEMNLRQHLPRKGPPGKETKRSSTDGAKADGEKKKRLLENLPKIAVDKGIRRLDLTALKKYKRHFGLKTAPTSSNKEDLQAAVIRHFASHLRAEGGKTERSFIKAVRDQKAGESK